MSDMERLKLDNLITSLYRDNVAFVLKTVFKKNPDAYVDICRFEKFSVFFIDTHREFMKKMNRHNRQHPHVYLNEFKLAASAVIAVLKCLPLRAGTGKDVPGYANEYLAALLAMDILKAYQMNRIGKSRDYIEQALPRIRPFILLDSDCINSYSIQSFAEALLMLRFENDFINNSAALLTLLMRAFDINSFELLKQMVEDIDEEYADENDAATKEDLSQYLV